MLKLMLYQVYAYYTIGTQYSFTRCIPYVKTNEFCLLRLNTTSVWKFKRNLFETDSGYNLQKVDENCGVILVRYPRYPSYIVPLLSYSRSRQVSTVPVLLLSRSRQVWTVPVLSLSRSGQGSAVPVQFKWIEDAENEQIRAGSGLRVSMEPGTG